MTPLRLLSLVALVVLLPAAAAGQGSGCRWMEGTTNVNSRSVGQNRVTYASTPRILCNDGRFMQADSALQFQASGYSEFIGNVVFRDRGRTLRARHATYYENLGRLEADGDVVLVEPDGNELRGERLLYLRAGAQRPMEQLTMSGNRPEAILYPARDTLRGPTERPDSVRPYLVEADRIFLQGSEIFQAEGNVEVERDSLTATADSLDYDQAGGALELLGRPARLNRGELDMEGRRLRLLLPGDVIEEVVAQDEAVLTTDSLQVDAPFIRLFLDEGELRRLVAAVPTVTSPDSAGGTPGPGAAAGVPPVIPGGGRPGQGSSAEGDDEAEADSVPRAVATTREIVMRADSIDVLAPAQRLQSMVAVGRARAVSMARDSLNLPRTPEILRNDWIEGDTVVALFTGAPELAPPQDSTAAPGADAAPEDSATAAVPAALPRTGPDTTASAVRAAADTTAEPQLERLRASIDARSLYRLDPDSSQLRDTTAYRARLPVSYAEADGIELTFAEGAVVHFIYRGLRRGQQLQPVRLPGEIIEPADSAAADSLAAPPDTTGASTPSRGVPPDTTGRSTGVRPTPPATAARLFGGEAPYRTVPRRDLWWYTAQRPRRLSAFLYRP